MQRYSQKNVRLLWLFVDDSINAGMINFSLIDDSFFGHNFLFSSA
jgi:hypothetical protein